MAKKVAALKDCGPGMIYDWRRSECIPIVKGSKLAKKKTSKSKGSKRA